MNPIYIGKRKVIEGSSTKNPAVYYKAPNSPRYTQIDIGIIGNRKSSQKHLDANDYHMVSMIRQGVGLPDESLLEEINKEDCPKACYSVFDMLDSYWKSR